MLFLNEKQWNSLEQWSPALLYIAGSLYLLLALSNFIEFKPPFINMLESVLIYLGPVSDILAIAGIVGIYPNLSDLAPKLSRVGVIFLAIAAITILAGFVPEQLVKLSQSQSLITILSTIQQISLAALFVGYLLLSIATFSTDYYPNILGYILLNSSCLDRCCSYRSYSANTRNFNLVGLDDNVNHTGPGLSGPGIYYQ